MTQSTSELSTAQRRVQRASGMLTTKSSRKARLDIGVSESQPKWLPKHVRLDCHLSPGSITPRSTRLVGERVSENERVKLILLAGSCSGSYSRRTQRSCWFNISTVKNSETVVLSLCLSLSLSVCLSVCLSLRLGS